MNPSMKSWLIFVLAPTSDCGEHKVYRECGSSCPPSCSTSSSSRECTDECVKGCFCADGYVEDVSRTCVPLDLCKSCTGNTTFTSCSYENPQICGEEREPPSEFEKVKCYIGCICKSGYVQLSADKLTCVLPVDCPPNKAIP